MKARPSLFLNQRENRRIRARACTRARASSSSDKRRPDRPKGRPSSDALRARPSDSAGGQAPGEGAAVHADSSKTRGLKGLDRAPSRPKLVAPRRQLLRSARARADAPCVTGNRTHISAPFARSAHAVCREQDPLRGYKTLVCGRRAPTGRSRVCSGLGPRNLELRSVAFRDRVCRARNPEIQVERSTRQTGSRGTLARLRKPRSAPRERPRDV